MSWKALCSSTVPRSSSGASASASTRSFSAATHALVEDMHLHPCAHVPSHAAGIRVAASTLDRDHQPIRLKLTTESDKRLEHVRTRRGVWARVVTQARSQLDPIARHRAVMAVQPSPQLHCLTLLAHPPRNTGHERGQRLGAERRSTGQKQTTVRLTVKPPGRPGERTNLCTRCSETRGGGSDQASRIRGPTAWTRRPANKRRPSEMRGNCRRSAHNPEMTGR